MKKFLKTKIVATTVLIIAAILTIICASLSKENYFVNKNSELLNAQASSSNNFELTNIEVINQAAKLLGSEYTFGAKGTKNVNLWGATATTANIQTEAEAKATGIDCSGLVYWTLSSLAKEKGWSFPNVTKGFSTNNPVPVDCYDWLTYKTKDNEYYWKEVNKYTYNSKSKTWVKVNSPSYAKSIDEATLTIHGKKINVLKKNDYISGTKATDGLRYYEYIDANGEEQTLPSGTIIISYGAGVGAAYDHAWICIGDLKTTDPKEVISILNDMGITISDTTKVVQESEDCTYWRIESRGDKGVIINNGDPNFGDTYTEKVNGKNVVKGIGPIWAFQVAKEVTINGEYNLQIVKVDENGNKITEPAQFVVNCNNQKVGGYTTDQGLVNVYDSPKQITSLTKHTYTITETKSPTGYKATNKATKFEVTFKIDNGKYVIDTAKVLSGDAKVSVNNGVITIKIENQKVDTGVYRLSLTKTSTVDDDYSRVGLNGKNPFNVKIGYNGKTATTETGYSVVDNTVYYPEIIIDEDTKSPDYIIISENKDNLPSGFEGTDETITLIVSKTTVKDENNNDKYRVYFITDENLNILYSLNTNTGEVTKDEGGTTINGYTVNFNDENGELHINVTLENEPQVDLALRKRILYVNDKSVSTKNGFSKEEDRVASWGRDNSGLADGTATTAIYNGSKTAVKVKRGDIITYRLFVFNEGTVDAKASKIVDYLPDGLDMNSLEISYGTNQTALGTSSSNKNYYELDTTNRKITIHLGDAPFINHYDVDKGNNGTVSYDYVTIKAKVASDATNGIKTNIAEITEYRREDTPNVVLTTDRDSQPDNFTEVSTDIANRQDDSWVDFKQNKIDEGLAYIPGQQDDDDFEKIEVLGNVYNLTLNKVEKDEDGENIPVSYYEFEYAIDNNAPSTKTTNLNGEAVLAKDQAIENTTTYTITEIGKTNEEYIKLNNPIKFEISRNDSDELSYRIDLGDGNGYTASTTTKEVTYPVTINNEYTVDIKVTFDITNQYDANITIEIENVKGIIDLALKKTITQVNGVDVTDSTNTVNNGFNTSRYLSNNENWIDVTPLNTDDSTDALYKMNKIPVEVRVGDTVKYKISIFNEGTIDAKASCINDYLPVGLKLSKVYYRDQEITTKVEKDDLTNVNTNAYYYDEENGIILVYLVAAEAIPHYSNNTLSSDYITVECIVQEDAIGVLTNVAEIRWYEKFVDGKFEDISEDIDSKEDNWVHPNTEDNLGRTNTDKSTEEWRNYSKDKDITVGFSTQYTPSGAGREDDDDFEKVIIVKDFDLSLCKFITAVNGVKLEGEDVREPIIDTSKLVSGESTTAEYTFKHEKEPVVVCPTDVVEYTIRIYNEGEQDGYAELVMDDIPDGVEMIAPDVLEDGTSNINAQYKWVMYKKYVAEENTVSENDENAEEAQKVETIEYDGQVYAPTNNAEEAELIVTDYLSRQNGIDMLKAAAEDGENPNLLKAFNYKTGEFTEENYRDIKVEFKVKATNKEDEVITNYAQITEDANSDGSSVTDRDSTPNVWEESPRNDDQDIEKIKVKYFDLALYKWVSSTIVTEDGKTKEYASDHTQDNKENLVNVTIPKDNLDETVVKFKYQIKVENQGNLAGYAKELKDHIPAGLKFIEEDNKEYGWKLQEDGTITTDYLKDTLLQPKQTAEVTVVLTWINGENNLGEKVNFAEISEDYNDYGAPDIDSTPNNFEDEVKEDDEDKDVVMLNVRTGSIDTIYFVIGASVIAILTAGVVGIKKFILN